jgi:probable HAF family extracellular repeat protein
LTSIAAAGLVATLATAQPQPRYTVKDLGTLPGGTFSAASQGNTDNGLVGGVATVSGGAQHAVVWYKGRIVDIATSGLGGPNSITIGLNARGQAVGAAETSTADSENFCAFGSGFQCLPFVWQNGVMTALPMLGGKNGAVSQINNRGEAAGVAENSTHDPSCQSPQVLDFEAVIWGPGRGQIRELRPLPGDSVAVALWINDNGQVVGTSGSCATTVVSGIIEGPRAVLWERDGSVHDLGNLGGTVNTALPAVGNSARGINNRGQVVGGSALPGNATAHAFLWTSEKGMRDLGTLPGDFNSGALAINDRGEVVGVSNDTSGGARAFLWQNGVMTDLNTLIPPNSPLFLLFAAGIDSRGEIAGFGLTATGDVHAFLAIPRDGEDGGDGGDGGDSAAPDVQSAASPGVLTEDARQRLQRLPLGRFGGRLMGPR